MFLIDSNIFLEALIGKENKESCEAFLEELSIGNINGAITLYAIHSVVLILSGKGMNRQAELFLGFLKGSNGVMIYSQSIDEDIEILRLMEKTLLDYDDCIQYFGAKKLGADAIVSFDKHFDKTDIERITPKQALERGFHANR